MNIYFHPGVGANARHPLLAALKFMAPDGNFGLTTCQYAISASFLCSIESRQMQKPIV
jgi:hypothetical protein